MNELHSDLKEINYNLKQLSRTLSGMSKTMSKQAKRGQWDPYYLMPTLMAKDILEETFECYHPIDGMIYTYKKGIFDKREKYNDYLTRLEQNGTLNIKPMRENFPVR